VISRWLARGAVITALLWPAWASAQVAIPQAPPVDAESYVLMDFDSGHVIAEKDTHDPVEPASITKLMTSYVAFHELKRGNIALDDEVLISERAWRTGGSRMFVEGLGVFVKGRHHPIGQ
jgi:D-alanyl-D-alanine carboxypeptidase (penicillin-binding protein 5/6)